MVGTDLERQEGTALELLGSTAFAERIQPLLPDSVPLARFVGIAKTALRTKPELVEADQPSLFNALIYLAQLGLPPDGVNAALNVYRTKVKTDSGERWVAKVQALPMVAGVRNLGAEYGWKIRAEVVYDADDFDVVDEPPSLYHKRARPGVARGQLVAAYAIAEKDGTRYQIVLAPDDIAKRRAKAKTDNIWKEWPEAMWRKSAVHALFRVLPKSEAERMERLRRLADEPELEPAAAAELLYGPDGAAYQATPAPPAEALESGDDEGRQQADRGEAEGASSGPAAAAPGPDDDEEPQPPKTNADELAYAASVVASTVVPNGGWKGQTLGQVHDAGDEGIAWLGYALRHRSKYDDDFVAALETYVQGALPELWEEHNTKAAA